MQLTILEIYLIGYVLALGISVKETYNKYRENDGLTVVDILSVVIMPLFSWWTLYILLWCVFVVFLISNDDTIERKKRLKMYNSIGLKGEKCHCFKAV